MARLRSQSLDFTAAKAMGAGGKDADMSPFSAAGKLLEARGAGRPPRWAELRGNSSRELCDWRVAAGVLPEHASCMCAMLGRPQA